jgi:hypothetical protein
MMRDREVIEEVLYYLANGRFQRTAAAESAAHTP